MQWTLGKRLTLLAVLPALLTALVLGLAAGVLSIRQAADHLDTEARLLAREAAAQAQAAVIRDDPLGLEQALAASLDGPHAVEAALIAPNGEVILRRQRLLPSDPVYQLGREVATLFGTMPRQVSASAEVDPPGTGYVSPLPMGANADGPRRVRVTLALNPATLFAPWQLAGFLGIALAAAALAGSAAWYNASRLSRPLHNLMRTVRRLEQGRLDTQIRARSIGEIGELEAAVNAMAAALHRGQQDLQRQVEQTTSELRQTLQAVEVQNVELDVARKRALEASKVKSEFLANVSHEIRTPINGILGFADLLVHSPLDAEQRDYVNTIKESCTNLLTIVNDILDFSKIEAGKLVIDNVAFDLRDSVEEVLSLLAPAAYGKSLELVHLIYSDVPIKLYGDPIRIRQVLTNLCHNAIKFTPSGRIVVRVMLEDESDKEAQLRITVADTGIGLSQSDQSKLFQAFSQADTSLTRRFGGAGLGLIISKKLLEQMGGNIGLESEPNQGSTFWFTLRCLKQPASSNAEPHPRNNPLMGRAVLVYDEEPLSRLACKHVLESWGVEVSEVDDRQSFLSLVSAGNRWDAAVLGLTRSELNARAYQGVIPKVAQVGVPLLVMASTVDRNELRSLYQQGARVCLPKAVRRQTLYRELCRLLQQGAQADRTLPSLPELPEVADPHSRPLQPKQVAEHSELRVLVVDDNEINRKLVSTILRRNGVAVDEAEDGHRAVHLASEQRHDLIFMDIQMPSMSGEEATKKIREHYAQETAPKIIALTANAMHGERERLLAAGMDECLIKPITEQQIINLLQGLAPGEGEADAEAETPAEDNGAAPPRRQALRDEMRAMLIKELPEHKRAIQRAYRSSQQAELQHRVHKLHGAVSVCHMPDLKAACADLEETLKAGERTDIPRGVQQLVGAINAVLAEEGASRAASL